MTKDDYADVGKVKVGRTTRFVTYYISDDDIEEKPRNPYHMPKLELAIKYAVRNKANILSPKLGSRINNLKFVSLMLEAYNKYGLKFAALDIWGVHWIPMDMMANIVAQNRKKISRNTKKAMAKLKAKGMKFGNPNIKEATQKASEDHTRRANDFAVTMRPVVKKIQKSGANTYQDIANRLNAEGIKSRYGRTWHPSNVRNLLLKIKELS
tara:strand:- start:843 stop:1472 length:630 start_codon:yes stop_codon:yes gene_type:complete